MTSTIIYQEPVLSYVYRLDHPTSGEFYFGYRKANSVPASKDLGTEYFTSSEYVEPRFHEFNYTIIQEFKDPLEAYDLEQFLIYQELKNPLMLNIRCYYGSKSRFTNTGNKHSQETKDKMSAAKKGVPQGPRSEESKAKQSATMTSVKHTTERKANNSAAHKGIPKSAQHKAKISATLKGKLRSQETKAKISASKKDKNTGPTPKFFSIIETRKTYAKANLSRYYPEFKQYY